MDSISLYVYAKKALPRELLESGTLARYIANLSVTGLTSNPTIFEHAIEANPNNPFVLNGVGQSLLKKGKSAEALSLRSCIDRDWISPGLMLVASISAKPPEVHAPVAVCVASVIAVEAPVPPLR